MKLITEFDLENTQDTGGKTGSIRVQEESTELFYQLKPSILDNSIIRQQKAANTDRENFGEVIAAFIGIEILGEDCVPKICLVYDSKRKRVLIASQYMTGDKVIGLDEYVKNELDIALAKGNKHYTFIASQYSQIDKGQIALDGVKIRKLKKSLAEAIAFSAISGDHDINPGNMLVITRYGTSWIARIDFGHAFNDLLNASKFNGGQLEDKANPVLDFFNRPKIAGVGGAISKLHRDYPGIILSQEMVDALRKMAFDYEKNVSRGIKAAKKEFNCLLQTLRTEEDEENIEHVKRSLLAIYENIGGEKLDETAKIEQVFNAVFSKYEEFVKKNCENAILVSNVLQLQVYIDDALKNNKILPPDFFTLLKEKKFPMKDGKIQWVRTDDTPPFTGKLDAYIVHRVIQLSQENGQKNASQLFFNYKTLNTSLHQEEKNYLFSDSDSYSAKNIKFFAPVKSSKIHEEIKINSKLLISELDSYIKQRVLRADKLSLFATHKKEDKINAVHTFINALDGYYYEGSLREHLTALTDGKVADIVSKFLPNVPGSKAEKVKLIIDHLETRKIWSSYGEEFR
ncbi:hypothetical protein [Legionella brunensis]|uniref:LepB N-terminal domain-containing protein n=1 Tax=Legionella brunensis TaxID=29422 RepID=A0A0W0SSW5_9GAMM|nr:hypothetical protein [Legionella brunensis]KTC86459.1 hypothetical protein Lbru_0400 [Legionella brunensis]